MKNLSLWLRLVLAVLCITVFNFFLAFDVTAQSLHETVQLNTNPNPPPAPLANGSQKPLTYTNYSAGNQPYPRVTLSGGNFLRYNANAGDLAFLGGGYGTKTNGNPDSFKGYTQTVRLAFPRLVRNLVITVNGSTGVYDGYPPQSITAVNDQGVVVTVDLTNNFGGTVYPILYGVSDIVFPPNSLTRSVTLTTNYPTTPPFLPGWLYSVDKINFDWRYGRPPAGQAAPPNYCGYSPFARPAAQDVSGHGWSMRAEVTDDDGLALSNVRLNGRLMAESLSVPYYNITTNNFTLQRGELKPDGTDATLRSRLVSYSTTTDAERLTLEAGYLVDQLPGGSQSCLSVIQRYEFLKEGVYGGCEPSETVPCSRWRPMVKYNFSSPNGETITSFNIAQRNHYNVNGFTGNSIGLFTDCDELPIHCPFVQDGGLVFVAKDNPVFSEFTENVIVKGNQGAWDNIHQTYNGAVFEPVGSVGSWHIPFFTNAAGCPECVHTHWRWGANVLNSAKFGDGKIIGLPIGSNQDVTLYGVRYHPGEEDVIHASVLNDQEFLRNKNYMGDDPQIDDYSTPLDVVQWFSATGYKNSDEFFGFYSFFNPSSPNITQSINRAPSPFNAIHVPQILLAPNTTSDGPTSITFANQYEAGATTFSDLDTTIIPPLPAGFVAYNNAGYDIRTTANASGPHTVTFCLPSATAQATFDNLRVFHAELDPFDPTRLIWVDRTILAPNTPAPNFANKTINARVSDVGPFVIGLLTQPQPPNTGVADLAVTTSVSANSIVAGNNLVYTISVTNSGPQSATGVVLNDGLATQAGFVSVAASQGSCHEDGGMVICNIGALGVGAAATVTVTVKPGEDQARAPGGKPAVNSVFVRANESDANQSNNTAMTTTTVLPDPNAPPTVKITLPVVSQLYDGPISFAMVATASDSDGSISGVEFFDNGTTIGAGTLGGANTYSVVLSDAAYGNHTLAAVATDNGGRKTVSSPVNIIVNGPAVVGLTGLAEGSLFTKPANVGFTATASYDAGSIAKVEFFANGDPIGLATASPYSVVWNNAPAGKFAITAVATDNNGIASTSTPVRITISNAPSVNLTAPANGAAFAPAAAINLTANASDFDDYVSRVDFYANGSNIGAANNTAANLYSFNWNPAPGSYALTAVATDGDGATTESAPVNVTVTSAPPTANITSPANNALFTAPANITINATATDSDGTVAKVDFYRNSTLIGTDTTSPYSIVWSNAPAGIYNLTAVATDNSGATGTSAAVSVTVNSLPTVSLTAPANGATFTAPANLTLSANAADADGTITKVEFFNGTTLIGTVTASPYNFAWNNILPGSYSLTAKATDNRGATKTSTAAAITVNSAGAALFVVGNTTLNAIDTALRARLLNLGLTVTVKSHTAATTADATGKRIVIVSESVTPANVNTKYRTVAVPVLMLEPQLFDDMGMTGTTSGTNFGSTTGQTQITISNAAHPLAAGLTGNVTVVSAASSFGWGTPNANAVKAATILGNSTRATDFGYSSGAVMPGLTAPARRVGFFLFGNSAGLTTNGGSLFDAAVTWAAGL